MITGAILNMIDTIVGAVLGILPSVPVPSFLSSAADAVGTVFDDANSMGVWFPTTLALSVLAVLIAVEGTAMTIKLARIVVSHLTGGGGGAA